MTSRVDPPSSVHLAPPQATPCELAPTVRRHTEMRDQWAAEALVYAEGLQREIDVMLRELPQATSGPLPRDDAGLEAST